ncbi:MAG: hypothetical protein ACJ0J5_05740 [Dehalococcoidia bacterium]|jgi:hypothetical protein|nr:hypothetical protein [Chloroflexota bacterium]RZP13774.1 MAG: hypothetical protein EVA32_03750 [Chloroflexota bacterium]|tara:strand:+ start:818 stop:1141 length:324 start_codon:yes stop_codon:yes gene_type:complete
MYSIRRVYKTKIGKAREAALLLREISDVYTDAGQRNKAVIYYNGGTLPCPKEELNRIYMHWSTEIIDSPYRDDNKFPSMDGKYDIFKELLDDSDGPTSWMEFWEEIK